jgi:hypothetical protein
MADFDWPADIIPFSCMFYLQPHTGGTESPFTRQTKVYGLSAPRWVARISLRAPDSADRWGGDYAEWGERIDAFLDKLEGRLNRVLLWDFRRPGRAPTFGNTAATEGTSTITLTGASAGDIRVGEYIGGDGRPHRISDLVVSGSDLIATVKPHWETDIALGGATFERVAGYFRLTSDDAGGNLSSVGELTQYDLEFVEDWGQPAEVIYEGQAVTFRG